MSGKTKFCFVLLHFGFIVYLLGLAVRCAVQIEKGPIYRFYSVGVLVLAVAVLSSGVYVYRKLNKKT